MPLRTVPKLRRALLEWYARERRVLPWRETRDPYRIWVSEIMLQQTRVAAVLEYYRKFLERFPDVGALARAREEDVLAAWSGLGYYRRARAMHRAARKVVERGGRFPQTAEELSELPGVGRYTAAAIASIAFGEAVAVVDGNVERVLSRIVGRDMRDREDAWDEAERLLARDASGDWNQAMMELGATVCLPAEPKCLLCPVRTWCESPGRKAAKPKEIRHKRELVFGLAQKRGAVYLVQRAANHSLMASMWELPPVEANGNAIVRTKHSITNSDYTVLVFPLSDEEASGGKWVQRSRLGTIPVTGLTRKILRAAHLWPEE